MDDGRSVRVGVIGGGSVAEAVHIPGLQMAGAHIVGLAHPREGRRIEVARKCHIPLQFADYHDLLKEDRVDAVVVCSPNGTHHEIVERALREGKHVLCEKPLALTASQALDLATLAERCDLVGMVAFTFRFVPALRYLEHLVRDGVIGRPLHWRAVNFTDSFADPLAPLGWRGRKAESGGGALMDLGPHLVDLALWLVGDIAEVSAEVATFYPVRPAGGGGNQEIDVDDSSVFLARFAGGALGTFELSRVVPGRGGTLRWNHQVIELAGSEGAVEYRLERPNQLRVCHGPVLTAGHAWADIEVPDDFKKVTGSVRNPHLPEPPMTFRFDQAVAWVRAIQGLQTPSPDFRDGWRCQQVLDAIRGASESRRWVKV